MVDNGICVRCALVAPAEVLDQISGIEHYASTAVELHLQKLWITLAKSNATMALERRFGRPDVVKLALEWRFGKLDDAKLALECRFSFPDGAKLALERGFGWPDGAKLTLKRRLGAVESKKTFFGFPAARSPDQKFMDRLASIKDHSIAIVNPLKV